LSRDRRGTRRKPVKRGASGALRQPDLLPIPGRSRDKPRSYSRGSLLANTVGQRHLS